MINPFLITNQTFTDSIGNTIELGSQVLFCGRKYTIKTFLGYYGFSNIQKMDFTKPCHTNEIAHELSVYLIFKEI